ncbi:hypothetical protein PRIPAC_77488 [Pristionchus pacificus]|uniref:G protein-coupled receptor n=1 Tax=Pristionchus pacificus TaxID=54126 RepID=A0A2A6CK45_PRIPA|nr:hypothetical protein PRIPAC_77488 [Pristionchus pacificus]|eukprot:PDM78499.1 G protein-coupled receptor [Pristionchus pacificus]
MSSFLEVVEFIEDANSIAGIVLNSILLIAIKRFSRPQLGTYKHLLTIFASVDIFLVILHNVVHPNVMRVGNIHCVVTDTVFDDKVKITSFFIGFQSVPFTILGIHFLYRYWSVRSPHLIQLFSRKSFIFFLMSLTVCVFLLWNCLTLLAETGHDHTAALSEVIPEYERKYGRHIEKAWILNDHWRDGQFDVTLITIVSLLNVIMVISLTTTTTLAVLTFHHIRTSSKVSAQAVELQRLLLFMLCAQAAVPCIFVYTPYVICIDGAFFDIPGTLFHDITIPILTCFPVNVADISLVSYITVKEQAKRFRKAPCPIGERLAWSLMMHGRSNAHECPHHAAIVLLLFADFRRGLIGMLVKRNEAMGGPTTLHITSTVVHSVATVSTVAPN